jgi:hypothetical protein
MLSIPDHSMWRLHGEEKLGVHLGHQLASVPGSMLMPLLLTRRTAPKALALLYLRLALGYLGPALSIYIIRRWMDHARKKKPLDAFISLFGLVDRQLDGWTRSPQSVTRFSIFAPAGSLLHWLMCMRAAYQLRSRL